MGQQNCTFCTPMPPSSFLFLLSLWNIFVTAITNGLVVVVAIAKNMARASQTQGQMRSRDKGQLAPFFHWRQRSKKCLSYKRLDQLANTFIGLAIRAFFIRKSLFCLSLNFLTFSRNWPRDFLRIFLKFTKKLPKVDYTFFVYLVH